MSTTQPLAFVGYAYDVAVDGNGNVYVVNSSSQASKISANGIVTTVAGNGTNGYSGDGNLATSAQLYYPQGVAVDVNGNIYIADTQNNRIRKVTPQGIISTIAGTGTAGFSGDGGLATAAKLSSPRKLAQDAAGNLYIADKRQRQNPGSGT